MMAIGCLLRWCHRDAQLADCLTKPSDKARKSYELLEARGFWWKLVYDPKFTSAKHRTKLGIDTLEDSAPEEPEEPTVPEWRDKRTPEIAHEMQTLSSA